MLYVVIAPHIIFISHFNPTTSPVAPTTHSLRTWRIPKQSTLLAATWKNYTWPCSMKKSHSTEAHDQKPQTRYKTPTLSETPASRPNCDPHLNTCSKISDRNVQQNKNGIWDEWRRLVVFPPPSSLEGLAAQCVLLQLQPPWGRGQCGSNLRSKVVWKKGLECMVFSGVVFTGEYPLLAIGARIGFWTKPWWCEASKWRQKLIRHCLRIQVVSHKTHEFTRTTASGLVEKVLNMGYSVPGLPSRDCKTRLASTWGWDCDYLRRNISQSCYSTG